MVSKCSTKKEKKKKGSKDKQMRRRLNPETTYVYILQSCANMLKSYVGVTNNLARRLRQHNGIIVGGARYTRASRPWAFFAVFQLSNRHDALSIEWKIKHQKKSSDGKGIHGRVQAALRIGQSVPRFFRIQ